ncbi:hypothetical protein [Dolichospermum flos-aquae]|uniref:Uncharacterized protein n=1 Tax=Dolichospermum flos-aquae LEGE 04289 TaxID=1828708 RepID=A0ACC5Q3E2_DOLFA|nr:hypothetical protein [Dolichospermum flos-aquae]MBE9218290.1 hypothetical protein [Dolichospermum flos-aquae LEGE 04289]
MLKLNLGCGFHTPSGWLADEVLDQLYVYVTYNSPTDGVLKWIIAPFIQLDSLANKTGWLYRG